VTRPRAAVVVSGSELVHGVIADANGPFLARELLALGFELPRIVVVGDRAAELESAVRNAAEADLAVVTGGLGPTHDDRTVEVVAAVAGVELVVRPELEAQIESVSRRIAERFGRAYDEFEPGVRKQAQVPRGGAVLGLAGTAPGLVVDVAGTPVVVLPGPPGELRRLWPRALEAEPVRVVVERARPPGRRLLRFFGVSESAVARAIAGAGGEGGGVDVTVCARDLEIEVDLLVEDGAEARADALAHAVRAELGSYLFAESPGGVEELVLGLCRTRALTLATAESCTGGLVGGRLTSVPGSSDAYLGGVIAYADAVKREHLSVPAAMLARHGAVSAEVAEAMAAGARARLGADVGLAVTGVAGPGGGTPEKPVGVVYLYASGPDGGRGRLLDLPGDRDAIRTRATVAALHLLRELLSQSRDDRS
jgi:competence/damage-inducible protein CinA-like protein